MGTEITIFLWLVIALLAISLLSAVVFLVLWLKGYSARRQAIEEFEEELKKSRQGIKRRMQQGSRLTDHTMDIKKDKGNR